MNEYKTIKLSNGQETIVDADDYLRFGWINWQFSDGYATSNRKTIRHKEDFPSCPKLHRLVIAADVGFDVDHINGNTLDNRKENLRICSRSQNNMNMASRREDVPKGAYFCSQNKTNPWKALIKSGSIKRHLGYFKTAEEAHEAYKKASLELHGEFSVFARKSS